MLDITQEEVDKVREKHLKQVGERENWLRCMMIEIENTFQSIAPKLYQGKTGLMECWYAGLQGICVVRCEQGCICVVSINNVRPPCAFCMEDERPLKERLLFELGRVKA